MKYHHQKYPFDCKIKRGQVKSYAYSGPSSHHDKHDDDNKVTTALAVGAGLAIITALASSSGQGKSDHSEQIHVSKSDLEDECHDMLQYRIRDEHNFRACVNINNSRIEGNDLHGEAKVKYDVGEHPHHAKFTCHFNAKGHVLDSQYYLY